MVEKVDKTKFKTRRRYYVVFISYVQRRAHPDLVGKQKARADIEMRSQGHFKVGDGIDIDEDGNFMLCLEAGIERRSKNKLKNKRGEKCIDDEEEEKQRRELRELDPRMVRRGKRTKTDEDHSKWEKHQRELEKDAVLQDWERQKL